eukprot:gene25437-30534_t
MATSIDLVADLGEGFGTWTMGADDALLDTLTSANIACGFHAGDPRTMDATVRGCVSRGIGIGAHPSFPDLAGFGRRAMDLSENEVRTDVLFQLGALHAFAVASGTSLSHIAPHGKLGNLVAVRQDYARAVVDAVAAFDPSLIVLAQDGALADEATARGLSVGIRTVRMVVEEVVEAVDGTLIPVVADTVLVHGDNPGAVANAKAIRAALEAAGVTIAPLTRVVASRRARDV